MKPAKKPTSKSASEKGLDKTGQGGEEERFNFAKPLAPVSKPKKKAGNVATVEQNYLDLWMPLLKNNKLYLEGNKLDPTTGAYFEERWHQSTSELLLNDKNIRQLVLDSNQNQCWIDDNIA